MLTQREMDLAASVQAVTEEIMLRLARGVAQETGERNLCLAGGVALNCVANGKLLRDERVRRIWIQPAAGDAGGALGRGARRPITCSSARTGSPPNGMRRACGAPTSGRATRRRISSGA